MTPRSPIFRKLFLSSFTLIAVTVLGLDLYLTQYAAEREVGGVQHQLEAQALILAAEAEAVPPGELEDWIRRTAALSRARVTLVDPQGVVIGDSQGDIQKMDNHASRPEIREALLGRTGISVRHSATINRDLVYLALPVAHDRKPGYALRLCVPVQGLEASISQIRWRVLGVSLLAAALVLVAAYFVSRSLTRRIRRLQSFAEGLVSARFLETLPPQPADELGDLARSLNGTAAQLRDLVERLSLESARREAILSSMVEGVLAVDNELNVTFCNEAFARAVGARLPVPERLPLLELVRDPALLNLLSRVLVTGQLQRQRLQLAAADGRSFEVQAGLLEAKTRRGVIAILHDITDLERLERVRRDFVANVSHELRTPLAAIHGYAETLLGGALEDKENSRKFVEIIQAHAVRLNNIAADLLVLSELESGERLPSSERIPVREAVEAALRSVEPEARIRAVAVHRGEITAESVSGQRLRLEQALVNLLDNAIKFNRPGGEVRIEAGPAPEGKIRISVSDSGIGIPSEHLPRVFERFYRVDKARSRELGGTGLGLSIVKHVVERMGGSVSVESRLGKGSKFMIELPAAS
jgi:two-component system phosphate regulon sensor histidine kinase PhoR